MAFLSELATNATEHGVRVLVYVGNDDSIAGHLGAQGMSKPFLLPRKLCAYPLRQLSSRSAHPPSPPGTPTDRPRAQNTTFGGIQGFTRPPVTPWTGDDGSFAGIVHQERNWTYVLFANAGHLVPQQQPEHVRPLPRPPHSSG